MAAKRDLDLSDSEWAALSAAESLLIHRSVLQNGSEHLTRWPFATRVLRVAVPIHQRVSSRDQGLGLDRYMRFVADAGSARKEAEEALAEEGVGATVRSIARMAIVPGQTTLPAACCIMAARCLLDTAGGEWERALQWAADIRSCHLFHWEQTNTSDTTVDPEWCCAERCSPLDIQGGNGQTDQEREDPLYTCQSVRFSLPPRRRYAPHAAVRAGF